MHLTKCMATNPAKGINFTEENKKDRVSCSENRRKENIDIPQVLQLIEASKETPIHIADFILLLL